MKLWIELITNQTLMKYLGVKNLRIAVMDLSFALFTKYKQLLTELDEYPPNERDKFTYVGEWVSPEGDYICKFKMTLKIKGDYEEEIQTMPIEGCILWSLDKAPENSGLLPRLGDSGREFVEGTFQREQRQMKFQGVRVDFSAQGLFCIDKYRLTVSEDGQSFEGTTAGTDQSWTNIIRGKTEKAVRREIVEEYIKLYHQNSDQQSKYSLLHTTDAILLSI